MGREGRLTLSELRAMERSESRCVELSAAQVDALENLLTRYLKAVPRSLKIESVSMPLVLFTDVACEPVGDDIACTVGGILFDPRDGGGLKFFGAHVSSEVVESWKRVGKKHPVALTELYAVCVARHIWKDRMDDCKCVLMLLSKDIVRKM